MPNSRFTLTRQNDGLCYTFSANGRHNDRPAYLRSDAPRWIVWDADWGWCAKTAEGDLAGLSFSLPGAAQPGCPPEGIWVSRKGPKSYVYDLRWI